MLVLYLRLFFIYIMIRTKTGQTDQPADQPNSSQGVYPPDNIDKYDTDEFDFCNDDD